MFVFLILIFLCCVNKLTKSHSFILWDNCSLQKVKIMIWHLKYLLHFFTIYWKTLQQPWKKIHFTKNTDWLRFIIVQTWYHPPTRRNNKELAQKQIWIIIYLTRYNGKSCLPNTQSISGLNGKLTIKHTLRNCLTR